MGEFPTLRAGVFLPPFHPNDEDPPLCMERDFQLMQWLDAHNYAGGGLASTIPAGTGSSASPNCSSPPPRGAPAHPAWPRGDLAARPPSLHGGRSHRSARLPDAWAGNVRLRPWA